jgi:hypothetical protein
MKVSEEKIKAFVKERGFADFLSTSAKTGENCRELKEMIAKHIRWNDLPLISTDRLLLELKNAVITRAQDPRESSLLRFSELIQHLEAVMPQEPIDVTEVRKAIRLLGSQGVILPLDFGDLILLRPAQLNNYATAVIRAARKHSDEVGCLRENDLLMGNFSLADVERLPEADELLLLRAILQTLLIRSLCIADQVEGGRHLVFPSQFRRERSHENLPGRLVTFTFSGELPTIFATLVVRLWHSEMFNRPEIWSNAAIFRAKQEERIGFLFQKVCEGTATIEVFADASVPEDERLLFIEYVHKHLKRYAGEDLKRERHYVCINPDCGKPITDTAAVAERLRSGKKYIICVRCDTRVPLVDEAEGRVVSTTVARKVQQMNITAEARLSMQADEQRLIGHMTAICADANETFERVQPSFHGANGRIDFRDPSGRPSGNRLHFHLLIDKSVFSADENGRISVEDRSAIQFWRGQDSTLYLVLRDPESEIRWMNVSKFLADNPRQDSAEFQFTGERLDAFLVMKIRNELMPLANEPSRSRVNAQGISKPGGLTLFYCYSHKDELFRDQLEVHLTQLKRDGLIVQWHDRKIFAGDEWKGAIDHNLEKADIILLVVSPDFIASDYCWNVEMKRALERHDKKEARVIPVIVRSCDWHSAPFGKLQALPKDGKPIKTWTDKDSAWSDVARGIRRIVQG